jgi:hypothetical protein
MDDFIKRNRAFLVSVVFLVVGFYAAGYAYFYQPYQVNTRAFDRELASLSQRVLARRAEEKKAAEEAARKAVEEKGEVASADRIRSISDFLEHINETARQVNRNNELPKVVLRELTPEPGAQLNFAIEIVVDYFTFLKFTAQLELRDMVINDLEILQYDPLEDPPLHLVRFRITPRNDLNYLPAGELRTRAEQVVVASETKNLRNPFQPLVIDSTTPRGIIDLTNKYKLTFIGRSGDRAFASIDRKTYFINDTLMEVKVKKNALTAGSKGKVITEINEGDKRVYLREEGDAGTFTYVIGFPGEQ